MIVVSGELSLIVPLNSLKHNMIWVAKAVVQKTISFLPARQHINFLFQKYVTKGVDLTDQYFSDKLTSAIDHLKAHQSQLLVKDEPFEALELGTGWYPVVPIALYLAGADKVHSIDVSPLLTNRSVTKTIKKYQEWYFDGKLEELAPLVSEVRLKNLLALAEIKELESRPQLMESIHLYPVVGDARKTDFEDNQFDLICSNNTFEHIPKAILEPILVEFKRLLKDGGTMSHFIDMSDHFAHMDYSISIYNFLRYSKKQWDFIDNTIQPQNRMRLRDYQEMYEKLGIEINHTEVRPGDIKAVMAEPLHTDFLDYSIEEIAISHALVVSKTKVKTQPRNNESTVNERVNIDSIRDSVRGVTDDVGADDLILPS